MDPRVKITPAALAQQFQLATQLCAAMHQDYEALQKVRALRNQLKNLRPGTLSAAVTALDTKASGCETLAQLNGELAALLSIIEGADAAPTTQAVAEAAAVQRALQTQLLRGREMETRDIPALNIQLQQANVPAIRLN